MKPAHIHDLVIAALAREYALRGYTVHTNPSRTKAHAIAGLYPDVVVMTKSLRRPRLVIEVETEASVRASEASAQWSVYDDRYGAWILAVPTQVRRIAKLLVEQSELRGVQLVTWSIDFAGLPR
jgi:hypothetical protein